MRNCCASLLVGLLGCSATEGPLLVDTRGADASTLVPATVVRSDMRLQYQLVGEVDATGDADLYVIDLFERAPAEVASLRAGGAVVIAYVAAGSREPWRPDEGDFPSAAVGQPLSNFPREAWLDVRDSGVRQVQQARLTLAADKGFDGVLLSSLDAYRHENGFGLSQQDQLDYSLWLAARARESGLAVGLSSDWAQASELAPSYDFAIHIGCIAADRCDELEAYRRLDRAVFDLELGRPSAAVCAEAARLGLNVIFKRDGYDAWRAPCP